jgi:hypothetical protein
VSSLEAHIIRKTTDADLHPNNMHTDDGFFLTSWRPLIYTQKECKKATFITTLFRASYTFITTMYYLIPHFLEKLHFSDSIAPID